MIAPIARHPSTMNFMGAHLIVATEKTQAATPV